MKKYFPFLFTSVVMVFSACYKDHGNYNYKRPETLTITGIEDAYSKNAYQDKLIINPTISSSVEDTLFNCFWGVYPSTGSYLNKMDTIAFTRQLNYTVALSAGPWKLVFCARNKKTGYSEYRFSALTVITQFTRGWYVIKDDGAHSDLDLFLTPLSITPEGKMENVIQQVNNRQLEGRASSLAFSISYKTNLSGAYANSKAIAAWSEKDICTLDLNSCRIVRSAEDLFFDPPATMKPDALFFLTNSFFLINNGNVHSIFNTYDNTGQFGNTHVNGSFNEPYQLSRYYFAAGGYPPIFFDQLSSSFMFTTGNGQQLGKFANVPASNLSSVNNNKTLLYMGLKTASPALGYAVLQDKTNPSLKLLTALKLTGGFSPVFTLTADTLATSSKMQSATLFTLLNADETLMYFVRGNEVWSRNLSNKAELLQYTVPAGETVSFIRHKKYAGSASTEQPYYFNYIIIGTTAGDNYKIRVFTKTAGNMSATPAFVMEGKGRAADITYIAPNVADNTYFPTF